MRSTTASDPRDCMPTPPGMIWLASYPKSGNTWLRVLLSNLVHGGDRPQDINELLLAGAVASDRELLGALTLLDSDLLRDDEIERLRPAILESFAAEQVRATFIKVHDAYTLLQGGVPLLGRAARAAVYVVRDPRDVVVSYASHNDCTIEKAIADLNDSTNILNDKQRHQTRQRVLDWSGHVCSWLDQSEVPIHVVRYEDLLMDTVTVFGRMLNFIGITAESDQIARAVRHSDFTELQRQERDKGFGERVGRAPFFRAGKVGNWRECLTAAQLHEIENAHGEVMERTGYRREGTQ